MTINHGGNIYELSARAGCSPDDILDFSASINPLGPPSGFEQVLAGFFRRLESYPDIRNQLLTEAISKFHGIDPEYIAVANGSTELIYWLPRALGISKALVVTPTFGEYAKAFELHGTRLQKLFSTPEDRFQLRVEHLEASLQKDSFEAVLLTHPSSPSGSLLDSQVVNWIIEHGNNPRGPLFLIDEVFIDFCEQASLKRFLERSQNIALIRSLTKFYGLPGLRIGYLLAPPGIAKKVRGNLPPWSVNTLAQAAGAWCFTQDQYRSKTLELVAGERQRLAKELSAIQGLDVFPAQANYLLVRMDRTLEPAPALKWKIFEEYRILIRDCGSFEGLDDWYFRVAVRLPDQNDRLIAALRSALSG
ncbi:threonine-phosphate decarboxylase [Syntrophobacter sp. SbD1]|nr:threonine-phosphate decarboxylase [Syntrophobacter sp. SbD1]